MVLGHEDNGVYVIFILVVPSPKWKRGTSCKTTKG